MGTKRCTGCGERFIERRNVPDQKYCSKPHCQRMRRSRWQREKLKRDADYRANQAAAQRRWRERHREYWRNYRKSHPAYTARNREQQRARNRRRKATSPSPSEIAKMDAYEDKNQVNSGTYRLIPVSGPGFAKMDAYLVKMQVLSEA